jgi:hypothetical protein
MIDKAEVKAESESRRIDESVKQPESVVQPFDVSPIPRFSDSCLPFHRFSDSGFLILEVLIASLIITASVAATMYLFRTGFETLERVNDSNVVSAKLPQAVNLLKTFDMDQKSGSEDMGDDVALQWESELIEKTRPVFDSPEGAVQSPFELYIYKVKLSIYYKSLEREYSINVLRSINTAQGTMASW